jgi:AraC-like DNA-binding protein
MPATATRIISDPCDYQAGFRGATVNLVLTGPGTFSARLTTVNLPCIRLYSFKESLPRTAYVALTPRTVNFTFSLSSPPPIWGGAEMKSQDLMFHAIGECMHQRTRGAASWSIISIHPELFAQSSKALSGSEIIPPRVGQVLRPSRADMKELRRLHAKVCRLVETKPKTVAHREVARAIQHEIIHALIHCLAAHIVHGDTVARRRRAAIMNRFEKVLAAECDRQLSTPELCRAVAAPERSLRQCCFDVLGMGPGEYMRLRRLNLAHVALQLANPIGTKVSEIAGRYGFSELGRFASYYRTIFGVPPLATLRGARFQSPQSSNCSKRAEPHEGQ